MTCGPSAETQAMDSWAGVAPCLTAISFKAVAILALCEKFCVSKR
jgi:hypothetical protein